MSCCVESFGSSLDLSQAYLWWSGVHALHLLPRSRFLVLFVHLDCCQLNPFSLCSQKKLKQCVSIDTFTPPANIILYKLITNNNNNCLDVTSSSSQEGKLDENKTSVFCVLFCLFCCHDLCQGLWNCIYKAVFVFVTVLTAICVSLLKEAGGGLVFSSAFKSVGTLVVWGRKRVK